MIAFERLRNARLNAGKMFQCLYMQMEWHNKKREQNFGGETSSK
jgi:hypothetical protein